MEPSLSLNATARLAVVATALALPGAARADCSFLPTAGDDTFVCDDGTSAGGLTDLSGDNTLRFPSGGSGTLDGNASFGSGADTVSMASGEITGPRPVGRRRRLRDRGRAGPGKRPAGRGHR